jgi:hypothetical protein
MSFFSKRRSELSDVSTLVADPASTADARGAVTAPVQSAPQTSHLASVALAVLGALNQAQPAIFAVTRAGPRTQTGVALGLGLAEIILGALLQPKAVTPTSVA